MGSGELAARASRGHGGNRDAPVGRKACNPYITGESAVCDDTVAGNHWLHLEQSLAAFGTHPAAPAEREDARGEGRRDATALTTPRSYTARSFVPYSGQRISATCVMFGTEGVLKLGPQKEPRDRLRRGLRRMRVRGCAACGEGRVRASRLQLSAA